MSAKTFDFHEKGFLNIKTNSAEHLLNFDEQELSDGRLAFALYNDNPKICALNNIVMNFSYKNKAAEPDYTSSEDERFGRRNHLLNPTLPPHRKAPPANVGLL